MDTQREIFEALLPRLRSLAMRILGDEAAADEVLDAVWEEWRVAPSPECEASRALLVAASVARPWQAGERADDISASLVRLLEGLPPTDRAVLLLRKVFCLADAEIAARLGLPEPECVVIVERASERLAGLVPGNGPQP